jgi:hypothetical protein
MEADRGDLTRSRLSEKEEGLTRSREAREEDEGEYQP